MQLLRGLDDTHELRLLRGGGKPGAGRPIKLNTVATQAARNSRAGSGAFSFTCCHACTICVAASSNAIKSFFMPQAYPFPPRV